MKKTKYFNKDIYEKEKKIKTAFIILIVFLIRFISWCSNKLHGITKQRKRNKRMPSGDRQFKRKYTFIGERGVKNGFR